MFTTMKDPNHWLYRLTAREWIQAALGELSRAERAYAQNSAKAGHTGARRAAGMALNGALIVEPNETWGRSYMEHVVAIASDASVPEAVRASARLLVETPGPGGGVISLRSRSGDERFIEAARTLMAHAYAVVMRHEEKS